MKKKILNVILVLNMLICMLPATLVSAEESGKCGSDAYWTLDSSGTLTISGTGKMIDYSSTSYSPFDRSSKIAQIIIEDGITDIGNNSFYNLDNLVKVSIGNGVKRIGESAFRSCSNLVNVVTNTNIESIESRAFEWCSSLTNIQFNNGLKSIGSHAFYSCNGLKKIIFPDTIEQIGTSSFDDCRNLTEVILGNGIKLIGERAFYNNLNLKTVKMGNTLNTIGERAFYNCLELSNFDMSANIDVIGKSAFENTEKMIVNYGGSEDAWKNVVIGPDNDALINAKINYNCDLGGGVTPQPTPEPTPEPTPQPTPAPETDPDAIKVFVDNKAVAFDQQPIIINDRVMVPIRAVAEALGDEVRWEGSWNAALIIHPDRVVGFKTENNTARIAKGIGLADYSEYYCDVPPQNINGRVLTPLRAIGETLGATVEWDGSTKTVNITTKEKPAKTMTDDLVNQILGIFEKWFK